MNDLRDLTLILRSRFPIVVVETHEETRFLDLIERVAALYAAHGAEQTVTIAGLLSEVDRIRPASAAMEAETQRLRAWAAGRTIPAH